MSIFKYFTEVLGSTSAAVPDRESVSAEEGEPAVSVPPVAQSLLSDDIRTSVMMTVLHLLELPPNELRMVSNTNCSASAADPRDVAIYVATSTSISDEKYQLLVNGYKPAADYKFPKGINGHAFQHRWFQLYPWLSYIASRKTLVTVFLVFFTTSGYRSDPGILVQCPLTSFIKALELFRKHVVKDYHKTAMVRAEVMENQQPNICHRISKTISDAVSFNRHFLSSIMKTIVLCGRQTVTASSVSSNATYNSSNVQNQLIQIIGSQIRNKILDRVRRAQWFTVIADEVTDFSKNNS